MSIEDTVEKKEGALQMKRPSDGKTNLAVLI